MTMKKLLDEYDALHSELSTAQGVTTGWLGTGKRASHRELHEINARRLAKREEIMQYFASMLTG